MVAGLMQAKALVRGKAAAHIKTALAASAEGFTPTTSMCVRIAMASLLNKAVAACRDGPRAVPDWFVPWVCWKEEEAKFAWSPACVVHYITTALTAPAADYPQILVLVLHKTLRDMCVGDKCANPRSIEDLRRDPVIRCIFPSVQVVSDDAGIEGAVIDVPDWDTLLTQSVTASALTFGDLVTKEQSLALLSTALVVGKAQGLDCDPAALQVGIAALVTGVALEDMTEDQRAAVAQVQALIGTSKNLEAGL